MVGAGTDGVHARVEAIVLVADALAQAELTMSAAMEAIRRRCLMLVLYPNEAEVQSWVFARQRIG